MKTMRKQQIIWEYDDPPIIHWIIWKHFCYKYQEGKLMKTMTQTLQELWDESDE